MITLLPIVILVWLLRDVLLRRPLSSLLAIDLVTLLILAVTPQDTHYVMLLSGPTVLSLTRQMLFEMFRVLASTIGVTIGSRIVLVIADISLPLILLFILFITSLV
jgi:hypothetical protein